MQGNADFSRGPIEDFNRVSVYYCDGSLRQGSREDPVSIGGKNFWFRGENNTLATLNFMFENLDFANQRETIIAGTSSGGISAACWANILKEKLHKINPYTKVKLIVDGGLFVDSGNYKTGVH